MNNGEHILPAYIRKYERTEKRQKNLSSVTKTTWDYVSLLMSGKCNLYGRCGTFSK